MSKTTQIAREFMRRVAGVDLDDSSLGRLLESIAMERNYSGPMI